MAGVLLLALLVVLSLVRGWDPRVGLRPRGLGGCGLVAEGFVGFWWCAGLWVAPWVGVSVGLCGWRRLWSGCCEGLGLGLGLVCRVQWVVWFAGVGGFGFGLGLGFGVALVLLVGQTVPDQ